jgi:uncharacterized protein YndB with AHSA1/START domain
MTMQAVATSVRASTVVDAPIERAFAVFTEGMAGWWPPEHHLIEAPLAEMVFEPRAGGHIYDKAVDGSECRWARDLDKTSAVEVRFTAEGDGRTLVELEHRDLDRHGERWEGMRDAVGSPDGWQIGLDRFARHVVTT